MQLLKFTLLTLSVTVSTSLLAQRERVKRKGTTPIDVTKKVSDKNPYGFSMDKLTGKWQEITRTGNKNNQPVELTDTIYLNFLSTDKVITREGNNMVSMRGAASIDGNVLLAAGDVYTILKLTDTVLILDNQDEYIHTLKKTDEFFFENYGKIPVKKEDFTDPVPVTLKDVLGKWMVYRKVAKPGTINPPVNIIQYLKITDSTSENTATGEVTFYQTDKSTLLPCTVKVTNAGLDITAGEFSWSLFVYKAMNKEMVFGDAAVLLYYAKGY